VLLNEKVLTAQVHFSLRTTFIFLPEDGFCFVDKYTQEEYPVDFYNVEEWVKHRLSPCVGDPALPPFLSRSSTLGSLLSLSDSLPSLPLRSRSNSHVKKDKTPDRMLSPQIDSSASFGVTPAQRSPQLAGQPASPDLSGNSSATVTQGRNAAYLKRTLADVKQFRAELAHRPDHEAENRYPPMSVIYAKDIPTVYAVRVASRAAIACADCYDDLVFHGGDGVVLARESMLPPGYSLVRDGLVCTDRGHVTLLGDLPAVGKALEAVVRGRRKGIGARSPRSSNLGEQVHVPIAGKSAEADG
jgi:hypothetical protein